MKQAKSQAEVQESLAAYRDWKENGSIGSVMRGKHNPSQASIVLADAYFAEHLADDLEPVTWAWLREVELIPNIRITFGHRPGGFVPNFHDWELPPVKTRVDVRRLCDALGIALKEPA